MHCSGGRLGRSVGEIWGIGHWGGLRRCESVRCRRRFLDGPPVQVRRERNQCSEVAVVGRFHGVDVFVPVAAGHDDGQVVALHQVPSDEGARRAAVAVGEGVYLREAVM